jgi:hypothetical protein
MKFCCIKFESRYSLKREEYLNIRIVSFIYKNTVKSEFLSSNYFPDALKGKFRFFITMGYEKFSLTMHTLNISFCPFCGTDLYNFYDKDVIPNETEGVTF